MVKKNNRDFPSVVYKPTALVAGGAGFIGSFLCQSLLFQGCRVLALDNLSSGDKKNLESCFQNQDFRFIKRDLTRSLKIKDRIDYVFHLAGAERKKTRNLLELAKAKSAKFLLVSSARHSASERFSEEMVLEYFRQGADVRIVRFDGVYGPRMNLSKTVIVAGEKSRQFYPIFISDAIYGLTKAMFTTRTNGEVFTLVDPKGIQIAEFIKKLGGFLNKSLAILEIDHSTFARQKLSGWKAKIGFDEGIKRTIASFSSKKLFRPKWQMRIVFGIIGFFTLIVFLTLPFWPSFFHLFAGAYNLNRAYSSFKKGNQATFGKSAESSYSHFEKSAQFFNNLSGVFLVLGMEKKGRQLTESAVLGKKIARIGIYSVDLMEKAEEAFQVIFKDREEDLTRWSQEVKPQLEGVYRELSFLEADLKSESYSLLLKGIPGISFKAEDIEKIFIEGKRGIADFSKFLEIFPQVLGAKERVTYLVLFQNNMELRATGGFIGSFALVSFDRGKMVEFEVFDVYSADGQLRGHVEPPRLLKEYLGEAGWYLRDSNWDPNFPTSAVRAEWFLEKTLKRRVDGVIGVNLNLPKKFLTVFDEIEMVDFGEKITAENLFQKAQHYAEVGFFPGSTQKRDFLGSLSRVLLERVKTSSSVERLKIAQAVHSDLQSKNLLFYFNDEELMKTVFNLGWGGALRQPSCFDSKTFCLEDYLMIVESNFGVNKANYFLRRNLVFETGLSQSGRVENVLRIDYLNGSPAGDRFGGDYKNFLRIYVPLGSVLERVKVGGKILPEEEIELGVSSGKTFFGFLVKVPAGGEESIEIDYYLPYKLEKDLKIDYLFFWQRQPGAEPSPFVFKVELPFRSLFSEVIPDWISFENGIWVEDKLDGDFLFRGTHLP